MAKKSKKKDSGSALGGLVKVAALSAAAYMLFGPEGKKNRKKIQGWAVKMKGEMIEKFEEMKEVSEPMYNKVVDELSAKYAKAKNINEADVKEVVEDLKKHWKSMVNDAKKLSKSPKKKTAAKKNATKKK